MAPFVAPLDAFHDSTPPNDWLEGLIKAYVGDGLATDFYREVAAFVQDAATRGLVLEVLADTGQAVVRRRQGARGHDAPTRPSRAGSRCGRAGWSARRSSRRSASPSSATR